MKRLGLVAMLVGACVGAPADESDLEEPAAGDVSADALTAWSDAVVSLRRDTRRCAAPLCGGYFARDVNRSAAEVYVSALDFSRAAFDDLTRQDVLDGADGEVLVRARLGALDARSNTRPLMVSEAWRALPGFAPRADDVVYRVDRQAVCVGVPCRSWRATRMNVGTSASFNELTASALAATPFVDAAWAVNEAYARGALVAGRVRLVRAYYAVLDAGRIYLKLPQRALCRTPPLARCPSGTLQAWTRGLDRCLAPAGCVRAEGCESVRVTCPAGYTARTWVNASGCSAGVCDPDFAR